jgi:hypothetical protein
MMEGHRPRTTDNGQRTNDMLKWLFRPSLLLLVALALAAYAAALTYWTPSAESRPEPRPVPSGDQEIAFLYQATNGATWERFVTAVSAAGKRLRATDFPDLIVEDANAFPQQTAVVPEVSLRAQPGAGRLLFRWYKLTSTQKTGDWVGALLGRSPPPLAVIGGNTSDAAFELATSLNKTADGLLEDERPLLLFTTATADHVSKPDGSGQPLTGIYPGRTYRFCFTNRQMAAAVTDFIWTHDELRPDAEPVYTVFWEDDAYSMDLNESFAVHCAQFPFGAQTKTEIVGSSVGTFDRPNPEEERVAGWLLQDLAKHRDQRRPLLVLAGQSQPSRRFLRALQHNAPVEARRFVIATGDTLAFNTVYRDRDVAWPIQDLPFTLVFFCHRNPVDRDAGFRRSDNADGQRLGTSPSGTEDLLLFRDIVEAVTIAAYQGDGLATQARKLGQALSNARLADDTARGPSLFKKDGNRRDGTGEHIVYLRPTIDGERILPKAVLTVWHRQTGGGAWQLRREPLEVQYDRPGG